MTRDLYVNIYIRLALDVDRLPAMLGLDPSLGRLIRALIIEVFEVDIGYGWSDIRKPPCHALVVAHDHKWQSGQRDTRHVKRAAVQMCFIPEVWHLMAQMHIVRQKRFSGDGVRSGDDPIVRS